MITGSLLSPPLAAPFFKYPPLMRLVKETRAQEGKRLKDIGAKLKSSFDYGKLAQG
jgi:hypothetical protein